MLSRWLVCRARLLGRNVERRRRVCVNRVAGRQGIAHCIICREHKTLRGCFWMQSLLSWAPGISTILSFPREEDATRPTNWMFKLLIAVQEASLTAYGRFNHEGSPPVRRLGSRTGSPNRPGGLLTATGPMVNLYRLLKACK